MSASFVIVLDPSTLDNPDTDLRRIIPDLIVGRSNGGMRSDGWGYDDNNRMHLFLSANELQAGTTAILNFIQSERVLGNNLSGSYVGVRQANGFRPIHPPQALDMIPDLDSRES